MPRHGGCRRCWPSTPGTGRRRWPRCSGSSSRGWATRRRSWCWIETAELKKGTATVGVGRQHAGITGQVENCQTVVFAAYVTARGHTLFDFRLYLPKQWCGDEQRRERAHVPEEVEFATKPRWAPR
jgi:SRSO17 transposase